VSIELIVVGMLVLPPVAVGVVGWFATRLSARDERRSEQILEAQRAGYARLGSEPETPVVHDRRAA
jgi:hypothetical protein